MLTVDAVRPTAVAIDTADGYALAVRPVAGISLTYDASVIDETTAARYLQRVRQLLETADWAAELPPID